jgi:hypothetical protein
MSDDNDWDSDLSKEEPSDRADLAFVRERAEQSVEISFGDKRFLRWKSDAPSGSREALVTAPGILGLSAAGAAVLGALVAVMASAPWWAALGFAGVLAAITIVTGIYLSARSHHQK